MGRLGCRAGQQAVAGRDRSRGPGCRHHPDDALGKQGLRHHCTPPATGLPTGDQLVSRFGAGLGGYSTLAASGGHRLTADAPSSSGPAQTPLACTAGPRLPFHRPDPDRRSVTPGGPGGAGSPPPPTHPTRCFSATSGG